MGSRRSPSRSTVALAGGLLAVAIVAAVAVGSFLTSDDGDPAALDVGEGRDVLAEAIPEAPHRQQGAPSPADAVAQFLDAEAADDWDTSYELLSLEDRSRFRSPETWASRRDGLLGSIESWTWTDDGPADPPATTITVTPVVSGTNGIKPPESEAVWAAVDEDGWRVSLGGSVITPTLPPADEAVDVARAWLLSGCGESSGSSDDVFVGSHPSVTADVCRIGEIEPGIEPERPTGRAAAELSVSFGPTAVDNVLAVPLAEPIDTSIIVVPRAEGWAVLDVLPDL